MPKAFGYFLWVIHHGRISPCKVLELSLSINAKEIEYLQKNSLSEVEWYNDNLDTLAKRYPYVGKDGQ